MISEQAYLNNCDQLNIVPIKDILQCFSEEDSQIASLNLYKENSIDDLKAICNTLTDTQRFAAVRIVELVLGSSHQEILVKLCHKKNNLKSLTLQNNQIDSIHYLLKIFQSQNNNLEEFEISGNKLGQTGVEKIVELLSNNNCLKKLSLTNLRLQDADLKSLGSLVENNNTIRFLSLADNNITGNAIRNFELQMRKNFSIVELVLAGNPIADEGFVAFTSDHMSRLKLIDFEACSIGARALEFLTQSDSKLECEYLNLSGNRLGSNGAKYLFESLQKRFPHLRILELSNNKIGNSAIPSFINYAKIPEYLIERINLSSNLLDEQGATMLTELFIDNQVLIELDLTRNCISNQEIQRIMFELKNWGAQDCVLLQNQIPKNTDFYNEKDERRDPPLRNIQYIMQTPGDLRPAVTALWENYEQVVKEKSQQIPLPQLKKVYQNVIVQISQNVQHLDISIKNSTLNKYALEFIGKLVNVLPQIYILRLESCDFDSEDSKVLFQNLAGCQHLNFLSMRYCNITAQTVSNMIEFLVTRKEEIDVDLDNNYIEKEGFYVLLNYLQRPKNQLNSIKVGFNNIDKKGGKMLTDFYQNHPDKKIGELVFDGNLIYDEIAVELLHILNDSQNQYLRRLSLAHCGLTDDVITSLSMYLKWTQNLDFLNLDGNSITDNGFSELLDALVENQSLISFSCRKNRLSAKLIKQVVGQLQFHDSLQECLLLTNQSDLFNQLQTSSLSLISPDDLKRNSPQGVREFKQQQIRSALPINEKLFDTPSRFRQNDSPNIQLDVMSPSNLINGSRFSNPKIDLSPPMSRNSYNQNQVQMHTGQFLYNPSPYSGHKKQYEQMDQTQKEQVTVNQQQYHEENGLQNSMDQISTPLLYSHQENTRKVQILEQKKKPKVKKQEFDWLQDQAQYSERYKSEKPKVVKLQQDPVKEQDNKEQEPLEINDMQTFIQQVYEKDVDSNKRIAYLKCYFPQN